MKRYNIFSIVFFFCLTNALGLSAFYGARIRNSTELPANITLVRAACDDKGGIVNPGKEETLDTDGCCLKKIIISSAGYQASLRGLGITAQEMGGYYLEYTPPTTGFGISCRDCAIEIIGNPKDGYRIEQR
jgi:hypothetical protein